MRKRQESVDRRARTQSFVVLSSSSFILLLLLCLKLRKPRFTCGIHLSTDFVCVKYNVRYVVPRVLSLYVSLYRSIYTINNNNRTRVWIFFLKIIQKKKYFPINSLFLPYKVDDVQMYRCVRDV